MRNGAGRPILVAGYMVRYPLGGQMAAHFQYVLGLARMGYDVHFIEDAGWDDACYDPGAGASTDDPSAGIRAVDALFARYGLTGRWTYIGRDGRAWGAPRERVAAMALNAPLVSLSDVTWLDEFADCPIRVYIDEDPAFPQLVAETDGGAMRAILDRYTAHFTYGENVGTPGCSIPTVGLCWQGTRQPIVLDLWKNDIPPGGAWTTLMNWTSYENVCYDGVEYGQKDVEFRRILDLPRRTAERLMVAVNGPAAVQKDLRAHGWGVVEAQEASRNVDSYRGFVLASRGEFGVAKHAYVATRSGWFSDRSAAYLAAGRPVVLQDTGFPSHLPVGEGLFAFTDMDSAREALERATADLPRHSEAARRLAAEHFDHTAVLGRLLERSGL